MKKRSLLLPALLLFTIQAGSQPWLDYLPQKKSAGSYSFYDYQQAFNAYWQGREVERGQGFKQFKRWEWFMESRVDEQGFYHPMKLWEATPARYSSLKSGAKTGASWTYIGPDEVPSGLTDDFPVGMGRIDAIAFHPTDSNTYWIGSPTGGLWKTTDNGQSWFPLTDGIPVLGIGDIAVNPKNPDIIYIGTGDRDATDLDGIGVLKTTDGGLSWNTTGLSFALSQGLTVNRVLIRPDRPDTLLAATDQGIYRTEDGGDTWKSVLSSVNIKDMEFRIGDPDKVLASTYGTQARVFKSNDGGKSFVESSSGLNKPESRRIALAVTPANPQVVYALVAQPSGAFQGLYLSTNFGDSWNLVTSGATINLMVTHPSGQGTGGQGWYDLSLAVSRTTATTVYVGGINLWKTSNTGSSWELLSFGYPEWGISNEPYVHVDHHALEWHPITGVLYNGNDGGIYRTYDQGESWQDISHGLQILQIYRIGNALTEPGLVITGSQDNGTYSNISNDWSEVLGGDGMECIIDYTNPQVLFASSQFGNMAKSFNGGITWYRVKPDDAPDGAWITPYIMHPADPDILYAGYDEVYKTVNGGLTWTRVSNILNLSTDRILSLAISPSHPEVVYAANRTTVWRTRDGGDTWEPANGGLPTGFISYLAVSQYDPNTAWLTFSNYAKDQRVYMTEDGGQNWVNYSGGLPNVPVNCVVYENNSNQAVYIGTDIGVFYRNRSMTEWLPFNDNLPNVMVNELEIHYPSGKLRAGTYGRGLWESDLYNDNSGALYAEFTVDRASSCVGSPMTFINRSPQDIDSLLWDFGPGATPAQSKQDQVEVVFDAAGEKSVSLTVYRTGESFTETRPAFVEALTNIHVSVLPSTVYIPLGDSIRLVATGADDYLWSPADGLSQTTGPVVKASPLSETQYTVSGTQGSCSDEATAVVKVIVNDDVCNALPLGFGESGPYANQNATVEDNEPLPDTLGTDACNAPLKWCAEGGLQHSVWFSFVAPQGGTVSIDSRGLDNQIAVYDAATCGDILNGNFTLLAANDDYHDESLLYAAAIDEISNLTPGKTYWVQVDGSAGGVQGEFFLSLYNSPLGTGEPGPGVGQQWVQLYPNPGTGSFNLVFSGPSADPVILRMFNLSGQEIYSREFPVISPGQVIPLQLDVPAGIYILQMNNARQAEHLKLVVE